MSNNGVIWIIEQQWRNGRDNPQWAFSLAELHALLSLAELHALLSLVKLSHAFLMHSSHWPAHALFSLVELSHAFLMHSSHWLS
jgi:hypothetical protein